MARVLRWPMEEVLIALKARFRKRAEEAYRFDQLMWAVQAPYSKQGSKPPEMPAILRDRR